MNIREIKELGFTVAEGILIDTVAITAICKAEKAADIKIHKHNDSQFTIVNSLTGEIIAYDTCRVQRITYIAIA